MKLLPFASPWYSNGYANSVCCICWLPYTKKFSDVVYNKYWNMCHKSIYKWCRNVQWTLRHQCRNVLGPKCLRSGVSVHCSAAIGTVGLFQLPVKQWQSAQLNLTELNWERRTSTDIICQTIVQHCRTSDLELTATCRIKLRLSLLLNPDLKLICFLPLSANYSTYLFHQRLCSRL